MPFDQVSRLLDGPYPENDFSRSPKAKYSHG
jgi:hypothetical protein